MVYVYQMMHLLDSDVRSKNVVHPMFNCIFTFKDCLPIFGHAKRREGLHDTLKEVYNNFTSIYKAAVPLLDELNRRFPEDWKCVELRKRTGCLITFCRCMLGRIFEEDGITVNPSLADLLAEIEGHLVDLVKDCTKRNVSICDVFCEMYDMMERIQEVYSKPPPINSYWLIINYDMMIEFLEDFETSFDSKKDLKQNVILLRGYLELLSKDRIHRDNLELMVAVEKVAFEMANYLFFAEMGSFSLRARFSDSDWFRQAFQPVFRIGVLKALVLQSDGFSNSTQVMSDELVIRYVKCVQENLLNLLNNEEINVSDTSKGQLMDLHERLSFLRHLLLAYPLKHNSEPEKLSNIRLNFQTLTRNVGSVICLYSESSNIDEMSLGLSNLIEEADDIKGEIIKIISCMIAERESLKKDQLGSLILLLQNLNKFVDHIPSLIITWKDHENLVLFIFYLIHNNIRGANQIDDDDFFRNTLHLDIPLIKQEELDEVLISAEVVAFNLACYSLLRRDGRFCWLELYLYPWSKEFINIHTRIGILKAIVLSSTTPLADELLMAYGKCVQDSLVELLRDETFDPLKDQFNVLLDGISFMSRLLINYRDESEKLSSFKVGFQNLVGNVGSEVCSRFRNWSRGGMAKRSTTELSKLVENMNLIIVETVELLHIANLTKIRRESPKTDQLGSLMLLLRNWKELMECESDLMITWKDQFQIIHENLDLLKNFITSSNTKEDESKNLCSSIMDAGYVAEYLLTTFSVGICPVQCTSLWMSDFMEHLERIKATVLELKESNYFMKEISATGNDEVSYQASQFPTLNDVVVGFEVEIELIKKQLYARLKQLEVISIVGMPGLGKTTLARKIYGDSSTIKYFDARAWCTVSQDYNKRKMLLAILGSMIEITDGLIKQSESEISVMIHKELIGRRYFIVLDDIWDIKVFTDIKCFFPDDNNGSRVMLTSRSKEIGSQAQGQSHGNLIEPGLLNDDQSWDLLTRKIYNKETCPYELCQIGKDIAKKCKGLPLGVVVVGGVLAKGPQQRDFWEQVLGNLSLSLARDSQSQFMATLDLSYEYLPDYLKPMFLYLGAFPEDAEISVTKLMRFWSAEGFLQNTESTSLESEAEKSLMDLIDRSLIMVSKRRWDGRVKVCHMHDLLRDMCLTKAKEEKFMQQVHVHSELPNPVWYQRRLSIYLERNDEITSSHLAAYKDLPKLAIIPPTCSILFFDVGSDFGASNLGGDIISSFKLLKIFDGEIFEISQDVLDKDLFMLVHLRYVSFFYENLESIPSSISRLRCLETLIIISHDEVMVPETIWEMTKLRHMHIDYYAKFSVEHKNSFILDNLQTFSMPIFDIGEEKNIFKKVPSLKKLSCAFKQSCRDAQLPSFESLGKLESLRVDGSGSVGLGGQLRLPLTLKKLTISRFRLKWSQISIFHTLPNLEYLDLSFGAVEDIFWDMEDDEIFANLKFLMVGCMKMKRWNACSENFPCLEKLVLDECINLKEIPSDLGEFNTLQEIVVKGYDCSLIDMVKEIKKEQDKIGNESLKVYIHLRGFMDQVESDTSPDA